MADVEATTDELVAGQRLASRRTDRAGGITQALANARAAGRRELADELVALIGDRVHLGPTSLGRLLTRLDVERDPDLVARELGVRGG